MSTVDIVLLFVVVIVTGVLVGIKLARLLFKV